MTADGIVKPGPTTSSLLMLRPTEEELEAAREASRPADGAKLNELRTHFTLKMGSKIWPSTDPTDSPFDTYSCQYCGWHFGQRTNGIFAIDLKVSPVQNIIHRMETHLRGCKAYKKRAKP